MAATTEPLAVITGASRGIGHALAVELAQRGFRIAGVARDRARLQAALEHGLPPGAEAHAYACDLTNVEQTLAVAASIERELGTPDVLVNNAGVIVRGSIGQLSPVDWDQQLAINLRAPFLLTRAFLPGMLQRGSGRILHVGSISATLGSPGAAAYSASKWGLLGFTKSLAEELKDTGLMTAVVQPGSVDTEMLAGSGFAARMKAEHVARTLAYLATDAPLAHNGASVEMFGV